MVKELGEMMDAGYTLDMKQIKKDIYMKTPGYLAKQKLK